MRSASPLPHIVPLTRYRVTYLCARNGRTHRRIVIRAACQDDADYTAKAILAGQVLAVTPLPDRICFPLAHVAGVTALSLAGAVVMACSGVMG